MTNQVKSYTLVFLQFLLIGFLLYGFSFQLINPIALALFLASALLLAWSVFSMRKSKLRAFPEPSAKATLITTGPYKYIRHPMYTSVLLACSGLIIHNFSWFRLLAGIILAIVLINKLLWEEKMLAEKFTDYSDYKHRTNRLVPFIF